MPDIRIILHPTDFSERSHAAYQLACSLARDHRAYMIVLHVVSRSGSYGETIARQQPDRHAESMCDSLHVVQAPDPRIDIEHRLADGDPQAEIVRVAQEARCDLIVMGTHGRTGFGRLLMGSVAEQVVRNAPCTVVTVKLPVPGFQVGKDSVPESVGQAVEVDSK
jgi:nucleotide-binding universal stress UspA family protein